MHKGSDLDPNMDTGIMHIAEGATATWWQQGQWKVWWRWQWECVNNDGDGQYGGDGNKRHNGDGNKQRNGNAKAMMAMDGTMTMVINRGDGNAAVMMVMDDATTTAQQQFIVQWQQWWKAWQATATMQMDDATATCWQQRQ
jgi:hypothetical protein